MEKVLPKAERLAMAFADHLWTHTYTNMVKVPSDQFQPIQTIVPSVRTYKSTYISEKKNDF